MICHRQAPSHSESSESGHLFRIFDRKKSCFSSLCSLRRVIWRARRAVTVRHFDSVPSCFGDIEMTRRKGAAGTSRQPRSAPKRGRRSRPGTGAGRRRGARSFKPGIRRLGLILVLAATVAGAAVTLHSYTVYSRWIDALLVTDSPVSRVIRAAPFRLSTGDHLGPDQFLSQLRRTGYGQGRKNEQLWFERSGQEIVFGRSDQVWRARFSGERLAALSLNGKTVQSAQLEPLFLSSFASSGRQRIRPLQYEDLPSHLIKAVISAEDDGFFATAALICWESREPWW